MLVASSSSSHASSPRARARRWPAWPRERRRRRHDGVLPRVAHRHRRRRRHHRLRPGVARARARATSARPASAAAPSAPPAAPASWRYCSSLADSSSISAAKTLLHPRRQILARGELAGRVHERLQIVVQIDGVLVAVLDVLGQRLQDDALELVGDAPVVGRRRQDLDVADLLQRREVALADEQPLAGEQLVEHDAEREDVAAAIDAAGRAPARATCSRTCP